MDVGGQLHVSAALFPGKEPWTPIEHKAAWPPRTGLDTFSTLPSTETRSAHS